MISISSILVAGTCIRLALFFDAYYSPSSILREYTHYSGLLSILYDPTYLLKNVRESIFVASLTKDGNVSHNLQYVFSNQRTHPTFLAMMNQILLSLRTNNNINTDLNEDMVFSLFAIITDLVIAYQLYHLAKSHYQGHYLDHTKFEIQVEKKMCPKIHPIRPHRTYLFGAGFEEEEEETYESTVFTTFNIPKICSVMYYLFVAGFEEEEEEEEKKEGEDETYETPVFTTFNVPKICSMIYYLNPLTILSSSCGIASIQGFWILTLISALKASARGNPFIAGFLLSVLCHFDFSYSIFILPAACYWRSRCQYQFQNDKFKSFGPEITSFLYSLPVWISILISSYILGWYLFGNVPIDPFYKFTVEEDNNLGPNLGIYWYLFINIFQRFREYFKIICPWLLFVFIIPFLIRFYNYPLEMVTMFLLLRALFNPTPNTQDMVLALSMIPLSRRTMARMNFVSIVCLVALPVPIMIFVIDYWLWLGSGSGNANFIFFQCLAYNLFLGAIAIDYISSTMKRDKAIRTTIKK